MSSNLEKAKKILLEENLTCVILSGNEAYKSRDRGVKPLVKYVSEKRDFSGYSAADKIVGKAAAMLYVLLGVKEVYAEVMSNDGIKTLEDNGIKAEYGESVNSIRNRLNTGNCPMENAVKDIENPEKAYAAILETIEMLKNK